MRKKINGVFTKKAHSVYAMITKRNSNRRRKKYFKTQKSSQNDVVRLYFTFFSEKSRGKLQKVAKNFILGG